MDDLTVAGSPLICMPTTSRLPVYTVHREIHPYEPMYQRCIGTGDNGATQRSTGRTGARANSLLGGTMRHARTRDDTRRTPVCLLWEQEVGGSNPPSPTGCAPS